MANDVTCKWCDDGDEPTVLDIDGVQSSISGQPGLWAHAYEDDWWPCQRKAAEEHAEVERLQGKVTQLEADAGSCACKAMNAVVAELHNLANGSTASGDTLAATICRDGIAEIEKLDNIILQLRGGIADLQRHVNARSLDDPPMFIPASMCAIIGAMHRVTKAAKSGGE